MEPYLGQIQAYGFNFAPRGWAECSGQLMPISSNTALFSLLGTYYGGDGRTTFALPDLRGRSIKNFGTGAGLSPVQIGQRGGREYVTLSSLNLPYHKHGMSAAQVKITTTDNENASAETDNGANGLGTAGTMPDVYRENPGNVDHLGGVSISGVTDSTGGGQDFNVRSPYLGVMVCIALVGLYPSRS